ncbi:hypothetical protein RKD35_002608 [Streptomyces albogriseolus]
MRSFASFSSSRPVSSSSPSPADASISGGYVVHRSGSSFRAASPQARAPA